MALELRNQNNADQDSYDRLGRIICHMDFWSAPQASVSVTNVAGDKTLPSVTVADMPTAPYTLGRAIAMFRFRKVVNGYAGENKLSGAQYIEVRSDEPGAWTDAISLQDDMFMVGNAATDYYYEIWGDLDVAGEVDAEDTYEFQWDEALADQDGLTFYDVQTGIRVYYEIETDT